MEDKDTEQLQTGTFSVNDCLAGRNKVCLWLGGGGQRSCPGADAKTEIQRFIHTARFPLLSTAPSETVNTSPESNSD